MHSNKSTCVTDVNWPHDVTSNTLYSSLCIYVCVHACGISNGSAEIHGQHLPSKHPRIDTSGTTDSDGPCSSGET